MSATVRVPTATVRFGTARGVRVVALDDLLLLLAECEIENDDPGARALAQLLRKYLKRVT